MVDLVASPAPGAGGYGPVLAQEYANDPRVRLARVLAASNAKMNDAPAYNPLQALAHSLSMAAPALGEFSVGQEYQDRQKALGDTMSQALEAARTGTKAWVNPDTGETSGQTLPPGMAALASVLSQSPDPTAKQMAVHYGIQDMTTQQAVRAALAKELVGKGQVPSFDSNGNVTGTVELPGYGDASGAIKGKEKGAEKRAEIGAEIELNPKRIAAETPAKVEQETAIISGTTPAAAGRAAAIAGAETPALVSRAAQTAAATAPIEVKKAADTAAATSPIHVEQARQIDTNKQNIGQSQQNISTEGKLRDDFNQLPQVKNYREAITSFNAITDAAGRDNKAADLNMIYGLGKIFDPNSVVREGELTLVKNTASWPEWLQGALNTAMGGGRLTTETRKQITAEAEGRLRAHESAYQPMKEWMESVAQRYGVDARNVVADVPRGTMQPAAGPSAPKPGDKVSDVSKLPEGTIVTDDKGNDFRITAGKPVLQPKAR
jgi:hypothetical protein